MADKKISQLTGATTPLAGTEVLPIVQSGSTVKVAVSDLTAGRSPSMTGLTVTGLTASTPVFTDASKALTSTGTVPTNQGGTGLTSFTGNSIVYASSTSALATSANLTFASDNLSVGPAGSSATWGRFVSIDATYPGVVFNSTAGGGKKWSLGADGPVLTFRNETDTATRGEMDAAGNLKLNTGNLVVGTAGKGLEFSGGLIWRTGAGTPEGAVTAPVGSLFTRTDGGANTTLYVKESGAGNTGWVAK
jgi:hypothetical protein